jgi:hypothetical protein
MNRPARGEHRSWPAVTPNTPPGVAGKIREKFPALLLQ